MTKASTKTKGVMFDQEGRVIVTDPVVAREIAAWVAERRDVMLVVSTEPVEQGGSSSASLSSPIPIPVGGPVPLLTCPNTSCPIFRSPRVKLEQFVDPSPLVVNPAVRTDAKKPRIIK